MDQKDNMIVLDHISKTYVVETQEVHALRKVSLSLPRSSMASIVGRSGAGKSTLLHILGTLDRPTSGRLIVDQTDLTQLNDRQISSFRNRKIGFVFQMNNLLPEFSALENVMIPGLIAHADRAEVRERASKLLALVGLSRREKHRPAELSGGEQQRVTIARSLLMAPPLLLADEPTGNLDKHTSSAIQDLLIELCATHQMTMVLVTHDKELARRLPIQILMEDGQIVSH